VIRISLYYQKIQNAPLKRIQSH